MKTRLLILGLVSAFCAFGQYQYDFSGLPDLDNLNTSVWAASGDGAQTDSPWVVYFGDPMWGEGSGLFLYKPTISGANPNDYEVSATLGQYNGTSTAIEYLRAGSSGSITVQLSNYGILAVYQNTTGGSTELGSTMVSTLEGTTIRSVIWGTNLWVYVNNVLVLTETVTLTTGQPGFGGYGYYVGFTNVKFGRHDTIAPSPVSSTGVRSSIFPTQASLQWQGVPDDLGEDSNGVGVYGYQVSRDGTPMNLSAGTTVADDTVAASTSYTYSISAVDFHGNVSTPTTYTVTTPPASSVDPRRTGIYTTGSYWGGGGEQIDTLSGNLNFSLPLVSAQGRTGWTVPVGLSYNSQNWRQDDGVNWELGADVGYGFGWTAQIGSITPYYLGWTSGVDHYVFTDGTGAAYRLDQNNGNVWSSKQGIYVWFDAARNMLHFKDGTVWLMGCTSGGAEQDAGTMYPTIIQDVIGNQVVVKYNAGLSLPASATNTSARIATIQDVRAVESFFEAAGGYVTYIFTYNTDAIPHLTSVFNIIGTAETYVLSYASASLGPPFGSDSSYSGDTTTHLASMSPEELAGRTINSDGWYSPIIAAVLPPYEFTYDSAGASELTQVTFPWGGHLRWTYETAIYAGNRLMREISNRYLAADSAGAMEWGPYPFTHSDSGGPIATVHSDTTLVDASGVGAKTWTFYNGESNPWEIGLTTQFVQSAGAGGTVYTRDSFTWAQSGGSTSFPAIGANPYISSKVRVTDEASPNATSATTTQTVDAYGNLTGLTAYPFNSTATPVQTYASTYLNSSTYTAGYMLNRLLTTTLTTSTGTYTPVQNLYDAAGNGGGSCWPGSPLSPNYGLVTQEISPIKKTCIIYDTYGNVSQTKDSEGNTTVATVDSSTNYAAPTAVATQSYNTTISYNTWLGITQVNGVNGPMSMYYDAAGRPSYGLTPYSGGTYPSSPGAIDYSYSAPSVLPAWQQKTAGDGVTKTILDGLGRAIQAQRGDTSGVQSYADTVYAPCACSPLGKLQKTSQPYAPGGADAWTTYTYDGIGRTLSVQRPDGTSTTSYSYSGNQTTVTDAAGNWKTFTNDVLGNLIAVTEPDPSSGTGGTVTTSYSYDWMNHLTASTMTRNGVTQTRTFVYNSAGQLTSATNPENGTVSYSYNTGTNTLASRVDANGQTTSYTYDSQNRMTAINRSNSSGTPDPCQTVTYTYSGIFVTSASYGTLTRGCAGSAPPTSYSEFYYYNTAGTIQIKALSIQRAVIDFNGNPETYNAFASSSYSYDNWGHLATSTYLGSDPFSSAGSPGTLNFNYGYDTMGRPSSMREGNPTVPGSGPAWVQDVTYDLAGRMTSMQYPEFSSSTLNYMTEAKTYNVNEQLTSMTWTQGTASSLAPSGSITYSYTGTGHGGNNGQITQAADGVSGETITYQYDALKRLTQASSAPNSGSTPAAWTQAFSYDGFGNLTGKSLNGGANSAPAVTEATNRLTNSSYDANGNMLTGMGLTLTYDEANRVASAAPTSGGKEYYGYAPDNKRIYKLRSDGTEEWTLYGPQGEKLGTYGLTLTCSDWSDPTTCGYAVAIQTTNVWFAGKLIWSGSGAANTSAPVFGDREGTNRANGARFYPYGDEITSTANDHVKFETYTRDGFTGLDYADQRYYASSYGRFNTVDPMAASLGNPLSWNRYSYALGDPINGNDPRGLCVEDSQGDFWDESAELGVQEDWGPGDCDLNPEWISMANGAAPGTVMLNGGLYLPGGGSVSVSATPDPVPCVSSFATSVDCSNPVDGEPVGNLQFISGVASGTGGFGSLLGWGTLGAATVGAGGAIIAGSTEIGLETGSLASALNGPVPTIGRVADILPRLGSSLYNTFVAPAVDVYAANQAWVQSIIASGQSVALASVLTSANLFNGGIYNEGFTMYGVELGWFFNAGYEIVGSYLVPPVK